MRAYFTLFLAFPFLSLFANNTHLLTFQDLLPVGALVLFGVVVTKFVKSDKVLLFVTFAWTMFYVMGLIRIIMLDIPEVWDLADLTAPMYTALISIVGFSMWKKRPTQRALKNGAKFASLLGLMLVVITIAEIEYEDGVAFNESHDIGSIDHVMVDMPNILLIIPDGYSRGDVLMDKFGFDNGPFEDTLRNMGYTIATDSHANYPHTHLSLSSTLNMIYLDELADKLGHGTANHQYAKNMIMDNMAMDILRDNGYTLVQIDSNWEATRTNELYDINLCNVSATTNELILLFSNTSIMSILGGGLNGDMHANRMCFFDSLDDPASWETGPGPYFIMGHIQMPHPPYLFNAQGEALILGTQCENCYINYLQFFNNQIIRAIDGFDGTVIIMSDHGWGADEQGWWDTMTDEDVYNRFATFVATNDASIDPNVSSVNIMRQVFDMPLLEDRAFMSQYQQSYNFKEVTNVINEFEESKP